ncbi:hypothetical protein [Mucilaginibacter humi]|uniref:hypothetical protein n=1 Tax=Mucilaginibacter humi TaxID=2732510 RepID=UPI00293BFCC3|nr:hypothetical protein [Mucilaginibacter humi]
MSFEEIKLLLIQKFGAEIIIGEELTGLQPALLIAPDRIADVCTELRNNSKTYFDFWRALAGLTMVLKRARLG